MERCGSFEYTRGVLATLHAEVGAEIDAVGGNVALKGLVELLHKQVVDTSTIETPGAAAPRGAAPPGSAGGAPGDSSSAGTTAGTTTGTTAGTTGVPPPPEALPRVDSI